MTEIRITVEPDGKLSFIYHDGLAGLCAAGKTSIVRASHVEPSDAGGWTADMSPSSGPVLGPFPTRAAALDAEVAWLRCHRNL